MEFLTYMLILKKEMAIKEYELYRQEYCGCEFSKKVRETMLVK